MDTTQKTSYIPLCEKPLGEMVKGIMTFEHGFEGVIIKISESPSLKSGVDSYISSFTETEKSIFSLYLSGAYKIICQDQNPDMKVLKLALAKNELEQACEISKTLTTESKKRFQTLSTTALAYYYKRICVQIDSKCLDTIKYKEVTGLTIKDVSTKAQTLAKRSCKSLSYGHALLAHALTNRDEKREHTLIALRQGSIDAMLDLMVSLLENPKDTIKLLGKTKLDFKLIREILETKKDVGHFGLLLTMKEFGIGGRKETPMQGIQKLKKLVDDPELIFSVSIDHTKALISIINLKLIIQELALNPHRLSELRDTLTAKLTEVQSHLNLPGLSTLRLSTQFEVNYYSGLAYSILKDDSLIKHHWGQLLNSLNSEHNNAGYKHEQIAREVYLKYSEILIDEGGDNFYKNKDIKKHLKLAKKFRCEDADAYLDLIDLRVKQDNEALKLERKESSRAKIAKEIEANKEYRLKEEQKQAEQKLELENRIKQQRLKNKKPTTITPEWIPYAQHSEKSVTVQAREEAADVIARMTAKAKKKAERPNALTKEKKLEQAEEVAIPESSEEEAETPILYINKTNRNLFLHVLDYASSRESSGNFGSTGSSDIKREELMGFMKQTLAFVHKKEEVKSKGKKNKGKGSHTCFTIPRLDNRDGAASRMATVPHRQSDVLKTYVRELADYFLELGYNEETVMDIRDFETKES